MAFRNHSHVKLIWEVNCFSKNIAQRGYVYPASMVSSICWERLFFQFMQIIFGWIEGEGEAFVEKSDIDGDSYSFTAKK